MAKLKTELFFYYQFQVNIRRSLLYRLTCPPPSAPPTGRLLVELPAELVIPVPKYQIKSSPY
jgi:hypothetical protein